MKKIFLIIFLSFVSAFGAIDECKTDVYFGNGIMTEADQAEDTVLNILAPSIQTLYGTEKEMKKHIGKFDYAYNSTHLGGLNDLMESLLQKTNLADRIDALSELNEALKKTAHEADLSEQVTIFGVRN